jgi:hypothetical protein
MAFALNQRAGHKRFVMPLFRVTDRSATAFEARIGDAGGRIQRGWALLFLREKVSGSEFRYAGDSHFPGGCIGHSWQGDARLRTEEDLPKLASDVASVREKAAGRIFQRTGLDRIGKVVPAAREDSCLGEHGRDPPGSGAPPFVITEPTWSVVGPDGPLPAGSGINPERARTS